MTSIRYDRHKPNTLTISPEEEYDHFGASACWNCQEPTKRLFSINNNLYRLCDKDCLTMYLFKCDWL